MTQSNVDRIDEESLLKSMDDDTVPYGYADLENEWSEAQEDGRMAIPTLNHTEVSFVSRGQLEETAELFSTIVNMRIVPDTVKLFIGQSDESVIVEADELQWDGRIQQVRYFLDADGGFQREVFY